MCERTNHRLVAAAQLAHDHEEWISRYRSCVSDGHDADIKSLMRLIYAQSRVINTGQKGNFMSARVVDTKNITESRADVMHNIKRWA